MTFIRTSRMSLSLSFRIRSERASGEVMLYCRLTFDGVRVSDYKSGVRVPAEIWPALPADHPQSAIIRLLLDNIQAQHKRLLLDLANPTAESLKAAWIAQTEAPKVPKRQPLSLLALYEQYVSYRHSQPHTKRSASKTLGALKVTGNHLAAYLKQEHLTGLQAEDVRSSLGYQFADYLFEKGLNADTVGRHICYVRKALDHAVRYDRVRNNVFSGVKIKGRPPKRIDFLSETDLIRLPALELHGIRNTVRKWALLMCYTGLDYHDALKVTANLGQYYQKGDFGETLVFQRLKMAHAPLWGECHIPILPVTRELLSDVLNWKRPKLKVINTHLKTIGEKLGLSFELKSKLCRKTAGAVMLMHYEDIYVVQKVLGHQSVKTTERHYVSILPQLVHKAMKKNPY